MFTRLPSLPALRSFEAAARLGSFKAAADELAVSPTAVSHQVRALEEQLETALFVRRTRSVELTEAGDRLATATTRGLSAIMDAVDDLRDAGSTIRLTTIPAFATLRLATAIASFERDNPGFSVEIEMTTGLVDLRRDRRFDLAIRYGAGPYEGLEITPLIEEKFCAYAAPRLAEQQPDLTAASLIETAWTETGLPAITWTDWFRAAGQPQPATPPTRFPEEMFVIQAAIAGQGVALISNALVGDLVARGLLAPVAPETTLPGIGYVAVAAPDKAASGKVTRFIRWAERAFSGD